MCGKSQGPLGMVCVWLVNKNGFDNSSTTLLLSTWYSKCFKVSMLQMWCTISWILISYSIVKSVLLLKLTLQKIYNQNLNNSNDYIENDNNYVTLIIIKVLKSFESKAL